jgi:hypothetical protein
MTTTTATRTRRAVDASQAFNHAILDAAQSGLRPHCSDAGTGGLWLSDHEADRAEACKLCAGCPVLVECRSSATARGERFGVWGGIDQTPPRQSHPTGVRREGIDDDPGSADYARSAQISVVGPLLLTTVKLLLASAV